MNTGENQGRPSWPAAKLNAECLAAMLLLQCSCSRSESVGTLQGRQSCYDERDTLIHLPARLYFFFGRSTWPMAFRRAIPVPGGMSLKITQSRHLTQRANSWVQLSQPNHHLSIHHLLRPMPRAGGRVTDTEERHLHHASPREWASPHHYLSRKAPAWMPRDTQLSLTKSRGWQEAH